jgi:hypothetical protein
MLRDPEGRSRLTRYLSLAGSSAAAFLVSGYAALIGGASLHCHRTLAGVHPNVVGIQ